MKYFPGISDFLEEISNLSHSVVFLYFFALITESFYVAEFYYSEKGTEKASDIDIRRGAESAPLTSLIKALYTFTRPTPTTYVEDNKDTIKDRSGMDLTEAEDIKKRWQEYTEELYKKDLNDLDNHDAVITHLEPDILESKVKWALGSITTNKARGGDGIAIELL